MHTSAPVSCAPSNSVHFRTDHLLADLKGRSVRGGAVTLGAQGVKFFLQLASTAVLARLLTPADFGLVAMVAAFTGFVSLFKDLGLSMATVQRAQITHEQVSTLFWINVALSILLMALAAALAPAVVWLYGEPRLTWIMLAIAATFIFGGLSAQHTALLRRQMRFIALAVIEVGAMAAGIGVAVLMALRGFGYWSLVGMGAASAAATALLCWMFSGWRPGMPRFRDGGFREMVAFGGHLTGFNLLNYANRNADNVIIGWGLGAGPVGIYSKAYALLLLPIQQINAPMTAVALPALSRLQNEPQRYRAYYTQAIGLIAMLSIPIAAYAFADAPVLILTVLGTAWNEAVPVFRLLAPAALAGTLNVAPGWVLVSLGQTDRLMRWALFSTPVTVTGFLVGLQWGILGVATAFSITFCGLFVGMLFYAFRRSPVRMSDLIRSIWRPMVAAGVAAGVLAGVSGVAGADPSLPRLLFGLALFLATYLLSFVALPGGASSLKRAALLVQQLGANNR